MHAPDPSAMPQKVSLLTLPNAIIHDIVREAMGNRLAHLRYRLKPSISRANSIDSPRHNTSDDIGQWQSNLCLAAPFPATVNTRCESEKLEIDLLCTEPDASHLSLGEDHHRCLEKTALSLPIGTCSASLKKRENQLIRHDLELKQLLEILYTCRQFSVAGNWALWTTWTFSFEDPSTCERFLAGRNDYQRQRLKKLRLGIDLDDGTAWNRVLFSSIINNFRALRVLHFHVRLYLTESSEEALLAINGSLKELLRSVLRLETLRLDTITVDTTTYSCQDLCSVEKRAFVDHAKIKLARFKQYVEHASDFQVDL